LQTHKNEFKARHAKRILQERAAKGFISDEAYEVLGDIAVNAEDTPIRLRAIWALHVTGGFEEWETRAMQSRNEYVRSWSIQLAAEDGELSDEQLALAKEMAKSDPSPLVRLYLASALQRIPLDQREPVLAELVRHESDAEDHNLPLMYWFAMEPVVGADANAGFNLLSQSKIPKLRQFITRRMTTESLATK